MGCTIVSLSIIIKSQLTITCARCTDTLGSFNFAEEYRQHESRNITRLNGNGNLTYSDSFILHSVVIRFFTVQSNTSCTKLQFPTRNHYYCIYGGVSSLDTTLRRRTSNINTYNFQFSHSIIHPLGQPQPYYWLALPFPSHTTALHWITSITFSSYVCLTNKFRIQILIKYVAIITRRIVSRFESFKSNKTRTLWVRQCGTMRTGRDVNW